MGAQPLTTMSDVAASAGSSIQEVAFALAGDAQVPADLCLRISDEINALGYRPLAFPQAQLGRPLRFEIVFKDYRDDDPEANRFYTPVASAIAIACVRHGAVVRQGSMIVDEHYELLKVPASVELGECDGAFVLGAQLNAAAVARLGATCPIVLVDGYSEGDALDSVVTDNVAGGRMAVDHLVAAGHRDIALLGTEPVSYPSMLGRRTGYMEAVEEHGLRKHYVDSSYVLTQATAVLGVDYVQRHPSVTAVFGANDLITVAFSQVARDAGFSLPADISMVGFDDIDLASLVMPSLTTIAIDKTLMGRAAFALMAHRIEVDGADPLRAVAAPRLIERESVAPARTR